MKKIDKKSIRELDKINEINKKGVKKAKVFVDDFRAFAFKGNILDLAIGLIIGTAFTKIVNSLVSELIIPLFSMITGKIDYASLFFAVDGNKYESIEAAKKLGIATINYGTFLSSVVDFLVMAVVIYVFMRYVFKKRNPNIVPEKTTKSCPYCLSEINLKATKCPNCTSLLKDK